MEVYISINGVLRNLIEKFEYHYENHFLDSDEETNVAVDVDNLSEDGVTENKTVPSIDTLPFDYKITKPVNNDNLRNYYAFQSKEEYNNFLFVDYPLEIFGHAGVSYMAVMSDLNKMIYENPDINFTIVGLDELGKARSSTLFFLSKYSYLGNNIKFIDSKDIKKEWKRCDFWITDDKTIIDNCPKNKQVVKFITEYNQHFTHNLEIKKLTTCSKSWEKNTTSTWTNLFKNVVPFMRRKKTKKLKILTETKNNSN